VNNTTTLVLGDTGSTTCVVKSSLVGGTNIIIFHKNIIISHTYWNQVLKTITTMTD